MDVWMNHVHLAEGAGKQRKRDWGWVSLKGGRKFRWMDGWTDRHTDGPRTDSHTEITPCSTGFVPFRATAKKEMLPALFFSSGCDKKLILYCVLQLINDSFWFRKRQWQTKTNSQISRHKQTQPEKRKMERDRQPGRQTDRQTDRQRLTEMERDKQSSAKRRVESIPYRGQRLEQLIHW